MVKIETKFEEGDVAQAGIGNPITMKVNFGESHEDEKITMKVYDQADDVGKDNIENVARDTLNGVDKALCADDPSGEGKQQWPEGIVNPITMKEVSHPTLPKEEVARLLGQDIVEYIVEAAALGLDPHDQLFVLL